jgi:tight adherence protein B
MFSFNRFTFYYFMFGIAIFLICQASYLLLRGPIAYRIDLNRRMRLILAMESRDQAFTDLMKARGLTNSGRLRYPFLRRFNTLLVQSGTTLGVRGLSLMAVMGGVIIFFILRKAFGVGLNLVFPTCVTIGCFIPMLWLMRKRSKRKELFALQLPDAIDIIARSLKAGHPVAVALNLVGREMADPVGTEFGILADEISFGLSMPRALQNLEVRVGQEDLGILTTAVTIQSETGGNLMELLEGLSHMLRERVKMRRKVRTLSSEGRFSAAALSALPFILFGLLNIVAPRFYGEAWPDPLTERALIGALVWMIVGNFVMYRMVNFKF